MKNFRNTRHAGERMPSLRRPLGHRSLNELLARRRRLRKRIGVAVAMFLSIGLFLAEFE
jgi:hypothetical protein